jgi:hypothetical protein
MHDPLMSFGRGIWSTAIEPELLRPKPYRTGLGAE